MSEMTASDPFVGRWRLLPQESAYTAGTPPRSGVYVIETTQVGYRFSARWTDEEGQDHRVSFEGIPDGQPYAYAESPMADTLTVARVGDRQLDTTVHKGGESITHTARNLSPDGHRLTIIQSGPLPEGGRFTNRAVYERMD